MGATFGKEASVSKTFRPYDLKLQLPDRTPVRSSEFCLSYSIAHHSTCRNHWVLPNYLLRYGPQLIAGGQRYPIQARPMARLSLNAEGHRLKSITGRALDAPVAALCYHDAAAYTVR
jgi:hypothetical protein